MHTEIKNALEEMLAELESHQLTIGLAPAPRPLHATHCVRVRMDQNPAWYRELCADFPSGRRRRNPRPDTRIKRRDTLATIRDMLNGGSRSGYALRILRLAIRRATSVRYVRNPQLSAA